MAISCAPAMMDAYVSGGQSAAHKPDGS
jgi:hypothetical protein